MPTSDMSRMYICNNTEKYIYIYISSFLILIICKDFSNAKRIDTNFAISMSYVCQELHYNRINVFTFFAYPKSVAAVKTCTKP